MADRLNKMKSRGWTKLGELEWVPFTPEGATYHPVLTPGAAKGEFEQVREQLMQGIVGIEIVRAFRISNRMLEDSFDAERARIEKIDRVVPANLVYAWHGAPNEGTVRNGIAESGLDNRYWSKGMFGFGAYLAAHPKKSHFFAKSVTPRLIFYFKVLLGRQEELQGEAGNPPCPEGHRERLAPSIGYNSILGKGHGPDVTVDEYVIHRSCQALPIYMIEYTGGP